MEVIYKYQVLIAEVQKLNVPTNAEILTIQEQRDEFFVWVKVDNMETEMGKTLYCFGTGSPIHESPLRHISTVQDGPMVWHFFEQLPF